MDEDDFYKHHIWCNFAIRPFATCRMCHGPNGNDGLLAKYPMDEVNSTEELLKKHFPEVWEMNKDRFSQQ